MICFLLFLGVIFFILQVASCRTHWSSNKKMSICRSDLSFHVFIKQITIEDLPYLRHC